MYYIEFYVFKENNQTLRLRETHLNSSESVSLPTSSRTPWVNVYLVEGYNQIYMYGSGLFLAILMITLMINYSLAG